MNQYGIPYMGSKSKIADKILELLPSGDRFVDLFGGGFAMSHAALLSGKYKKVVYNEINPLVTKLIKEAIDGKYNYDCFSPAWISREKFFELKEKDGYIKYIWSFGNNGRSYLFGKNIEPIKRAAHNAVVFGDEKELLEHFPDWKGFSKKTITERRKETTYFVKNYDNNERGLEQLERLQQLQQLERLQQLQQLELIEICNKDYREIELRDADVMYCDPPYKGTGKYSKDGFNHDEFYEWLREIKYPVFFSEYSAPDDFVLIETFYKRSLMNASQGGGGNSFEKLFWNGKGNYKKIGCLF